MSTAKLLSLLQAHQLRVFTTKDILLLTNETQTSISHSLRRLEKDGLVLRVKRGVWINKLVEHFNPFETVPYLTAPWPAYVSLHSALADYGVIEEIPQIIYAVTAHLPEKISTPVGRFHMHHLNKNLIWGYEIKQFNSGSYPIADPEKAFLDLVYLSLIPRSPIQMVHKRSKRWQLNIDKLKKYALKFQFPPLIPYLERIGLLKQFF